MVSWSPEIWPAATVVLVLLVRPVQQKLNLKKKEIEFKK